MTFAQHLTIWPGFDESVCWAVQGAPDDDDGGDDQDPKRNRRGEYPTRLVAAFTKVEPPRCFDPRLLQSVAIFLCFSLRGVCDGPLSARPRR